MVSLSSLGNMLQDCTLEYHTSLETLRGQPWQIDSGIDADRSESVSIVKPRRQLIFRDRFKLGGH